jgi:hypothetical protein
MKRSLHWAALALAALVPATLQAQSADNNRWSVNLRGGTVLYEDASALERGALIGAEALYRVTPRFSIGPTMDFVKTKSDGEFFVGVYNFGPDTARAYEVGQNITVLHYGLNGVFQLGSDASRMAPYLAAGIGGHTLYLDPQENNGATRDNGIHFQAGGGLRFGLGEASGLQIDARDMIYLDFDREGLNPIPARFRNRQVIGTANCTPEANGTTCLLYPAFENDVPDAKSTLHNIRLSLAFTYTPGASR